MLQIPLNERVIFALDVANPQEAEELVRTLDDQIRFFKVGLQLFLAGGWSVVDFIAKRGNKVMLDLKLYDIPATVRLAVEQFADRGVNLATVHGYIPVVQAALEADSGVNILAVTVLTSFGEEEVQELGFAGSVDDLVVKRARRVLGVGCHGLVCSAREAACLRDDCGNDFIMVTPGIRPAGSSVDDQQRVATPSGAIRDGADYLVIGRSITAAEDPMSALHRVHTELAK
jgi:orotidine-5'-phosphate decarboxylase